MKQNTKYDPPAGGRNTKKGFTFIEALAFLFIFSVITLTFYQTWSLGTKHIINSKNRLGATALASQQIEIIRSLPFDNIGTTTGIPVGIIAENQTITESGATYAVHTLIQFVDDATDGTLALGTDAAPNDYKKATVTVSWGGGSASEKVSAESLFSLDGVESVAAGTGILSVNVLNDAGEGVPGVTVHVTNTSLTPGVDTTFVTDANGNNTFPGARASVQGYQITTSKSGYYGNQTYPPNPPSTFDPTNVHTSVVAGSLTTTTLVSDQKSTIELQTKDPYGAGIPNIDFSISGGLAIGTKADGSIAYDYTENASTDGGGDKSLGDRSSGMYTVALDSGETGYEFIRLTPEEPLIKTIHLLPNTTKQVDMVLASKTFSSALVMAMTDGTDSVPISGASIHLENVSLGYGETVIADTYGQAYFPVANTALLPGTYDVEITATGFATKTGTIVISGSALEEKTFLLTSV